MQELYPGKVNSPLTALSEGIDDSQETVPLEDASKLPDAPNIATIGRGEEAETIKYEGKDGDTLTGVTRGFQGTAKSWDSGTVVVRVLTAYDWDGIRQNFNSHLSETANDAHGVIIENANDYESGAWTPIIEGSDTSGEPTYSIQEGAYTKIGNLLYIRCRLRADKDTDMEGNILVKGLPFNPKNSDESLSIFRMDNVKNLDPDVIQISTRTMSAANAIGLYENREGTDASSLDVNNMGDTNFTLFFSGTYEI